MFNDVGANPASFARYVRDMVAACSANASLRFGIDVAAEPALLAPFHRIVVAPAGLSARHRRAGDGPPGARRRTLAGHIADHDIAQGGDWFYYRARKPTADDFTWLAKPADRHRDRRPASPARARKRSPAPSKRRCCRR